MIGTLKGAVLLSHNVNVHERDQGITKRNIHEVTSHQSNLFSTSPTDYGLRTEADDAGITYYVNGNTKL